MASDAGDQSRADERGASGGSQFPPNGGAVGCDVPGHPNNYAHVCAEWDVANAIAERWGITLSNNSEESP